jgi:DNA-binding transcriptional regulator YiaG
MAIDVALEMFPESKMQIEEHASTIRNSLMERYNDALIPTLKRPLSPGEIEEIRANLREERRLIEEQFKNHIFYADKTMAGKISSTR